MKIFFLLLILSATAFAAEPAKPDPRLSLATLPTMAYPASYCVAWSITGPIGQTDLSRLVAGIDKSRDWLAHDANCVGAEKTEVAFKCSGDLFRDARHLTFDEYLAKRIELEKQCKGQPVT